MSCPYEPNDGHLHVGSKSTEQDAIEPIPQPPVHWLTKNLPEMNPDFPSSSIRRLADTYGPILKLDLVTTEMVIVSTHALVNEACNEDRFEKVVIAALTELRTLLGDGLFTAYPEEIASLSSTS